MEEKNMPGTQRILGVNRRYYPIQASVIGHEPEYGNDQCENLLPTTVVLIEGDIGDYTAYCGHGDPEWVARFGDKISFEEACCHFPGGQLKSELYRR